MVFSFLPLRGIEENLCSPDPKYFPDPSQRKELYISNLNNLRAITDFLVVYFLINIFLSFPISSHIFWVSICCFHLILLLVFCRTKIWVWHWAYTLGLSFSQFIFTKMIKGSFISALNATFITPVFVFQITNEIHLPIINFLSQFILLQFHYKSSLKELLLEISPEDFSEKFINSASLVLVGSTVIYGLRSKLLQDIHNSLKQSKLEAEQACSQLTLFLHTFSHELRNPLNSLLGNLELALHEALPLKVQEMVDTAKVCGDLLLQLINNILDTGKAQLGKLDINPSSTRIVDFVSGVWRMSRDLIKRKKLNGYLKIDKRLPPILYLDYYRINQILLNLISNSLKFTEKGQIWIKFAWLSNRTLSERCFQPYPYDEDGVFDKEHNIRAIFRSTSEADHIIYLQSSMDVLKDLYKNFIPHQEQGILKIIVRDTGPGIKKEKQNLLFTKFAQISDDPMKREIGTGLGLYITKEICKAMGGEIRAFTKVGVGTTFIACIPTYSPSQILEPVSLTDVISKLNQIKLHALIADDNIFNLDLLSNYILKIEGKVLDTAKNGLEGYEKYVEIRNLKQKLHIVYIDIDMPILDGISMCKRIREFEAAAKLQPAKIVLVSGNYEASQVNQLLDKQGKYKGDSFLKKPISFEAFLNVFASTSFDEFC